MISSLSYSRLSKFYLAKWVKTWQCNRESYFAGVVALKQKWIHRDDRDDSFTM